MSKPTTTKDPATALKREIKTLAGKVAIIHTLLVESAQKKENSVPPDLSKWMCDRMQAYYHQNEMLNNENSMLKEENEVLRIRVGNPPLSLN